MPRKRSQQKFIVLETKNGFERSEYGTRQPGKTIWEMVVDYINSLPIDHVFTRRSLTHV